MKEVDNVGPALRALFDPEGVAIFRDVFMHATVFHGTLCRHYVPPNASTKTRVSLDFRIGVEGCFDPRWVLRGTLDDHHRREIVL